MMAARWSNSTQDNEEKKHKAVTLSCQVGGDPGVLEVLVQLQDGGG